jgi:hypothetical protein
LHFATNLPISEWSSESIRQKFYEIICNLIYQYSRRLESKCSWKKFQSNFKISNWLAFFWLVLNITKNMWFRSFGILPQQTVFLASCPS